MSTAEHKQRERQAAGIGDNRPPLRDRSGLDFDYRHLEVEIGELSADVAETVPVCEDDDDLTAITELVKRIRDQRKRVASIGDSETRPLLEAQRVCHAFFNEMASKLTALQADIQDRGNRYLQRKAEQERSRREAVERKARADAEAARMAALEAARIAAEKEAAAKPRPIPDLSSPGSANDIPEIELPLLAKQEEQAAQAAAATALDILAEANQRAADASEKVAAKPSDMARTRTVAGTASLRTKIEFTFDMLTVDLEILRPFLKTSEVYGAINALAIRNREEIEAGTFSVRGVAFTVASKGTYR